MTLLSDLVYERFTFAPSTIIVLPINLAVEQYEPSPTSYLKRAIKNKG